MQPGRMIAGRFEVQELAGTGAMGQVWKARDRQTGDPVAVKVMSGSRSASARGRFEREAHLLRELRHAGIVRHVDSGTISEGELFLAMEWLDGQDLHTRLDRGEMEMGEAVQIGLQTAEALGFAHRRGIVHRDVKPSNLFLVAGSPMRVKVLDFGIARWAGMPWQQLTSHGALIGTPGYMAPEQGRGERTDARADVFSLGCVLFECVTGLPAFVADAPTALLLKILVQEVPLLGEIIDGVPEELEHLVARMLAKDAAGRPADAAEVADELEPIARELAAGPIRRSWTSATQRMPTLTGAEQRMVSVVLLSDPTDRADIDATLTPEQELASVGPLLAIARHMDVRLEALADGSLVALVEGGAATDQAARAVRCAYAMREAMGPLPAAIATGRARLDERLPVGPVIDRVSALVRLAGDGRIRLDDLTAGLLDARFQVGGDRSGLWLEGERPEHDGGRTLLGHPTPYVGRTREQRVIEAAAAACADERISHALLVTGPPGMGKSRLRREVLAHLCSVGPPMTVWIGRGDPFRTASSHGLLADALAREAGTHGDEPLELRRKKLRARVARHVAPADVQRLTEVLGELAGVPFPDEDSVKLRAARRNPAVMADHVRAALADFLRAECAVGPVAIVLEDVQWADGPSVALVGEVLEALSDAPLLVLAFGRDEVLETFPALWEGAHRTHLRLGPLPPKSAEQLVRAVIPSAAPDRVEQIVERAGGNPFLLEELVRSAAEGRWEAAPETALAVVQARIEALSPDLRRVLRAASVFGEAFWPGGLVALLGRSDQGAVEGWLEELVEGEWVTERAVSRFAGERELAFRHELIRQAAYGMLTDQDRTVAHRLAARWLEETGEMVPVVLAEHFEKGGEPERAAQRYLAAARQAARADDYRGAVAVAERGVACGAEGEVLGELRLAQADAASNMTDRRQLEAWATEAMSLTRRGTASWLRAVRWSAKGFMGRKHVEGIEQLARDVLAERDAEDAATRLTTLAGLSIHLLFLGRREAAEALMDEVEGLVAVMPRLDPDVRTAIHQARARRHLLDNDRAGYARELQTAAHLQELSGNVRSACEIRANLGFAMLELGRPAEAEAILNVALEGARRLGLDWTRALAQHNLGLALAWLGRLDEALAAESEAARTFHAQGEHRLAGAAHSYLSTILELRGDAQGAEKEARRAIELLAELPLAVPRALAALARSLLSQGRAEDAMEVAADASERLRAAGTVEEGEGLIRLVLAEALEANGRRDLAREAIGAARARLMVRCARMDEAARGGFLLDVPEHARTLELANEWGA